MIRDAKAGMFDFIITKEISRFGSALTSEIVSAEEGQYKLYGQANLIRKDFDYGDNFVTEENYRRLINYEVLPDDIAVSMMGTIGKCSVVPHGIKPCIMDSHLIKIRLSNKMNPRFFEYVYESCVVYEQLVVNSKGSIMNCFYGDCSRNKAPSPVLSAQTGHQRLCRMKRNRIVEADSVNIRPIHRKFTKNRIYTTKTL